MKLIRMINKQMETIGFDPVSGNEVPLGGTPEGVRDDIDAKLSKGEMVIPEYAVNYHGVETYIKSIQKAQEGYQQIQDMGLVGNPDEAIMDESEPLPKMGDENIPEYQTGGLTTTALAPISPVTLPSVPTTPSVDLTQPLAPVSTQVTPTTQSVGSLDVSTLQVGGYKIIPYVNAAGNTLYVPSINGQVIGAVPTGYSPATEQQTASQQTTPIQQQLVQQPVKVEPKVTISPAGSTPPSTAVPSATTSSATTPSAGKSSLSAENQATIQSIHSQSNLSGKDIAAMTAPDAKSPLSKTAIDLGKLGTISYANIAKAATSIAAKALVPSIPMAGSLVSNAVSALAFSGNQPATAMMQGAINPNTGKPSIAGTGYHPASGWSFHATETPLGLVTVSFNDKDVTLNTAPSVVQKGQLALAFNKDFTDMTDTEISESMQTDSNGHITGFNAPNAIGTPNGGYLSDGSFQSALGKSATGYAGDFSALSAIDQAVVSFKRSQQPLSFLSLIHISEPTRPY